MYGLMICAFGKMKGFRIQIESQVYQYACENSLLILITEYIDGVSYMTVRRGRDKLLEYDIASDVLVSVDYTEVNTSSEPVTVSFDTDKTNSDNYRQGLSINVENREYQIATEGGICGLMMSYNGQTGCGDYSIQGYADGCFYYWEKGTLEHDMRFEITKTAITALSEASEIVKYKSL